LSLLLAVILTSVMMCEGEEMEKEKERRAADPSQSFFRSYRGRGGVSKERYSRARTKLKN
jgi:hypothetical protein